MVLRMKNFNVLGVHWKIWLLRGGGGSRRTNIEGGDCLKRGAWAVCWFKGGLGKKEEGGVFEEGRGWDPNAHYAPPYHPI